MKSPKIQMPKISRNQYEREKNELYAFLCHYSSKSSRDYTKSSLRSPSKATFHRVLTDLILIFLDLSPETDELKLTASDMEYHFVFKRLGK